MRRLILIIPALFLLVIVAAVTIALITPESVYRNQIQTSAEAALGREVALDGPLGLSFFPRIAASVSDVSVANPEGFDGAHMIEAGELRASVKWGPLLTGRVQIQELALIDATIGLQRLADGSTNWEFAGTEDVPAETDPDAPAPPQEINAGFDQARIVNTTLTYSDAVSGDTIELSDFNLEAEASSLSSPLRLRSDGLFDGQPFDIQLVLETPNALLGGEEASAELVLATDVIDMAYNGGLVFGETQSVEGLFDVTVPNIAALADYAGLDAASVPVPLQPIGRFKAQGEVSGAPDTLSITFTELATTSDDLTTSFVGGVSLGGDGAVDGTLSINSDNLRGLLEALAVELTPGDTLRNFSVTGKTQGTFQNIAIEDLSFALDDTTADGRIGVDLSTARPKLTGALTTSALDLTPFLGPAPEDQPAGWSKTPLALDSLTAADADLTLKSPSIKIDQITLTDTDVQAVLTNGRLSTNINQVDTFGGRWAGTLGVNAASAVPSLSMDLTGSSILMEELMRTLAGSDRLGGTGQFSLNISSAGASIHDIMNALDGELSANLADGALKGVNLGQLFRTTGNLRESLTSGSLNLGISAADQTDFASFDTLLSITDGVARIRAMDLINSALSAHGSGTIDLGAQTLNMGLQFAADTTGQGQLSDIQLNGMAIPLKITGTWTSPSIAPDTQVLTRALAGQQIDRLTDSLGGEVGGALSGILGGAGLTDNGSEEDEDEDQQTPEEALEDAARDALGGLFRRD
ncbi:MAG: AsmA family protein [Pseudomonadota bacterium]